MALISAHSSTNKVTHTGLSVRYRSETDTDRGLLVVTRYATKVYSFVGMTYSAARDCADAKAAQYLRKHASGYTVTTDADGISAVTPVYVTDTLCSIAMTHGEGDSWDVNISVSEQDVRATTDTSTAPAKLFATENAWDYDETDEGGRDKITITSASASSGSNSVSVTYTTRNPITTPSLMKLAVTSGGYSKFLSLVSASGSSATFAGDSFTVSSGACTVTIVYGNVTSNIYSFTV